jgi:rhodanese-related sulfurtransferase
MDLDQQTWWEGVQNDDNSVVLDVRTPEEFEEGFIPNALNIDIYKGQGFVYLVDELDKSKKYYVYCKAGGRSHQACKIMQELGFQDTYNLLGGIMNWEGPIQEQ